MKQKEDGGAGGEDKGSSRFKGEETVGEILLAARENKGLTIDEVSQETKIAARNLEYLETDNFEAIPAKVYVKGFLRTYAGMLGLDVEHILSKYEVQSGQTHTSKGDLWEIETDVVEEKLRPPRIFKRFILPVILVIAAVFIFNRITCQKEQRVEPPPTLPDLNEETLQDRDTAGIPNSNEGQIRTGDVKEGAAGPLEGGLEPSEGEPEPPGGQPEPEQVVSAQKPSEGKTEPQEGAPEPSEGEPSGERPESAEPEPAAKAQEPTESAREPSESTREPPDDKPDRIVEPPVAVSPLELRLTANQTDSTWFDLVILSTVDERREGTVYDFILLPGQEKSFQATDAFIFREVSNAGGFTIELNGRRLPPLGGRGEVIKNVWITLESLPED